MRAELPNGQWADLRERLTHGQDKEIRRALVKAQMDPEYADAELNAVALKIFLIDWNVNDLEGNRIPITDGDAIDRAPSEVVDLLATHATVLYKKIKGSLGSYGALIGRMVMGYSPTDADIDALPDPDLFRDAMFLARHGRWSPDDLNEADTHLIRLVRHLQKTPVAAGKG
jgi:hypothetical protein